eukprot:TRINITY_DN10354_c0_g1_i1.p1 TRINITY_DN10354_c0_g1~~TRINITY_DN10354_c0_g1_i1.p1  ORF type:complete len:368 (-),score=78.89 TRINITY_DN10354_c0_g1_i1:63-1166(-)
MYEEFPLSFWSAEDQGKAHTRFEQLMEERFNKLVQVTGLGLWKGNVCDVVPVTLALKDNVSEAKQAAAKSDAAKPVKDYVIRAAKEAVQNTSPFISSVKVVNMEVTKSKGRIKRDRATHIAEDCKVKRIMMLKSHKELLEAILALHRRTERAKQGPPKASYDHGNSPAPVIYDAPVAQHPGDVNAGPFRGPVVQPMIDARNAILMAFRDFYMVQKAPPPNTLEALNYKPWRPERTLLQYTQASIKDFKDVIMVINSQHTQFQFDDFQRKVVAQIGLLVPVVKIIRAEISRLHQFATFPNDVKMFVNAIVRFLAAMDVVKNAAPTSQQDPNVIKLANARGTLINTLRGVLTTLRQMIIHESQPVMQPM